MQDTNVVDINRAISNYRNCECFFFCQYLKNIVYLNLAKYRASVVVAD